MRLILGLTIILLALVGAAFTAPAHAEFWTGAQLKAALASQDSVERVRGEGYLMGVFDGTRGVLHCAPDMPVEKVVDVVTRMLAKADEKTLADSADQVFVPSLVRNFPCRMDPLMPGPGSRTL